jgi:hypothetical protein
MNRVGLGLAVGAGYLLGRTRKLKFAVAVGTFVAGKRMNLGPGGLAELVSRQLQENPQFKEIGDQIRGDLRGVGKAASSAMVERQLDALADRLHDRTAETRDRLAGAVPAADDLGDDEEEPEAGGTREDEEPDAEAEGTEDEGGPAASKTSGGRSRTRKTTAPAKKAGARKTTAKKAAKATKSTTGSAAKTASRGRRPKGGGER